MRRVVLVALAVLLLVPSLAFAKNDNINLFVKDKKILANSSPVIRNDRTLVPVRAISESLGYRVGWHEETKRVLIENGGIEVVLKINSPYGNVGGKKVKLDVAPSILNDRTYVPIRFVSEAFGLKVDWDDVTRSVLVETKLETAREALGGKELDFDELLKKYGDKFFKDLDKERQRAIVAGLVEIVGEDEIFKEEGVKTYEDLYKKMADLTVRDIVVSLALYDVFSEIGTKSDNEDMNKKNYESYRANKATYNKTLVAITDEIDKFFDTKRDSAAIMDLIERLNKTGVVDKENNAAEETAAALINFYVKDGADVSLRGFELKTDIKTLADKLDKAKKPMIYVYRDNETSDFTEYIIISTEIGNLSVFYNVEDGLASYMGQSSFKMSVN